MLSPDHLFSPFTKRQIPPRDRRSGIGCQLASLVTAVILLRA